MLANLKIGVRLILLVSVMAALLVVIGIFGLHSAEKSNAALALTYQDRLEPTGTVGRIMMLMADNRSQIMLGLQHNPENPLSKLHDHPVSMHSDTINKNRDEITALWDAYAKRNLSPEERGLADKYAASRAKYVGEGLMPARDALLAGEFNKANEILLKLNSVYRDANQDADALLASLLKSAKTEYAASEASYQSARTASILTMLFGLVFGIGFSLWIIRSITVPVEELKSAMRHIRESNDLTRIANVPHHDEIGQMAEAFNGLMDSFRSIIGRVTESTAEVTDAAVQLAAASSQVAESTHHQSDAAASMATAVEQMTVSVGQVAEHAREAQTISQQSGELSVQGGDVIHSATGKMLKIADSVNQSSEMVRLLGEESSKITSIVNVIKDIADQTNLLALNAAIEAARAGEQGRGFAVVADEVRKLAERTAKSTQEIAGMVGKIQIGTKSAVSSMEAGVSQVNEGVALANQAGEAITHIRDGSQRVVQTVNDISLAIKEQSVASEEIATNVEKIAQMSEQNSAAAQQTASTANHLQEMAASLKSAVSRFRV